MTKPRKNAEATRTPLIYARISKDRATEHSIDLQIDTCTRYCDMKGWQVGGVYVDRGRSAYKNTPRPELDRLFGDIEAGVGNQLVVYKLDRLARSVRNFTSMYDHLADNGAEFTSVTEGFDTTTAMGKAMLRIAAVFAELESDVKSERITDWHDTRRGAGSAPTGPRPFGYGRPDDETGGPADHRSVIRLDEAAMILAAADKVIAGESLRSIVTEWNLGPVMSTRGTPHTQRGVRIILTNPHTAGLREVAGVLMKGQWTGILSREQHDAMCSILNDEGRRTSFSNERKHLLTGIARCGLCQTPMGTVTHPNGSRYLCKNRKGYEACGKVSIECRRTDEAATKKMLDALDLGRLTTETDRQRGTVTEQVDALEAELLDLVRARFDTPAGQRPMSADYFTMMKDGIEAQIVALHAEETTGRVSQSMRDLAAAADPYATFSGWDLATQRSVMLSVVDFVAIKPARPGSGYDQSRVDLVPGWKK